MIQWVRSFGLIIAILTLGAGCAAKEAAQLSGPPTIGDYVPDFKLQDRRGRWHRLSDFRGNVVFLNFWATWCPPCVGELPLMDAMNKKFKAKNFVMIGVSVDDSWATIGTFYKEQKSQPSFLVLLDAKREVSNDLFGTNKYPESYVIDPQGRLLKKYVGAYNWLSTDKLEDIDDVLAKKTQ